jgi:hypothetical protein
MTEKVKARVGSDEWIRAVNSVIAKARSATKEERGAIFAWLDDKCGPEAVAKAKQVLGGKADAEIKRPEPGRVRNPMLERYKARLAEAAKGKVIKVGGVKLSNHAAATAVGVVETLPQVSGGVPAVIDQAAVVGEATTPLAAASQMWIESMNRKHSLIGNVGGKCMVLDWVPLDRDAGVFVPSFQTLTSFRQRYNDTSISTEEGRVPRGDYWLLHRDKSKFDGITFRPGAPAIIHSGTGGEYCCRMNLWRSWGVKPKKGKWPLLREHVYGVLAGGKEDREEYILNWVAHGYQKPGVKRRVLLGFRGGEGTGKGLFGHAIKRTYGSHGGYITQPSHLVGKFNRHLRTCCFLFLDEAFWAGDRQGESVLKSLITDEEWMIEGKGIDPELAMNWIDVMLASNAQWVVPASHDARRYAIFDVDGRYGEAVASNEERKEYFRPLWREIESGGLEAMMWDMLERELGDWEPQDIPKTEALMEQKQRSLRGFDKMYESILQDGVLPRGHKRGDWSGRPDCATTEALMEAARAIRGCEHETAASLKIYLKAMGVDTSWRVPGFGRGGAKFPALSEAREMFARKFGGVWPWTDDLEKWEHESDGMVV